MLTPRKNCTSLKYLHFTLVFVRMHRMGPKSERLMTKAKIPNSKGPITTAKQSTTKKAKYKSGTKSQKNTTRRHRSRRREA